MASGRLIDYLGVGLASARPASPDAYTGALAFWFATDLGVLSAWDGSTWADIADTNLPLPNLVPTGGWAQGDMLFYDSVSGAFVPITAGVPGQVLTMSSGEIPIWDDLPP